MRSKAARPCRSRAALVAAALVTLSAAVPAFAFAELLQRTATPVFDPTEPAVGAHVWVRVDTKLLEADPPELTVDLPDGGSLHLRRTSFERRASGRVTWHGAADGGPEGASISEREPFPGQAVLTLYDGFVAGWIFAPERGAVYALAPIHGVHRLARLRPEGFPECGGTPTPASVLAPTPASPESLGSAEDESLSPLLTEPAAATGPPTLDLLVLYTPPTEAWAGGPAAIGALIGSAVDLLDTSLANSRVDARARLAGMQKVDFVEEASEDMGTVLRRLTQDPQVARLRDETRADLVSLWINATEDAANLCGIAWGMRRGDVGRGFADFGFSVMRVQCAVDNLTFPHELGHNLGAFHLPGDPDLSQASFPWSFGYFVPGLFRTIMAPGSSCVGSGTICPRIPVFSNPDVDHRDEPTGIRNQRDVHRTFGQTVPIGAAFRIGPGDRPSAPQGLTARPLSTTGVELSWRDTASNETGFQVQRAVGESVFATAIGALPRNTATAVLDDLEPGLRYRFRVRARNPAGFSAFSNVVEIETLPDPPPAPEHLDATVVSATAVHLSWEAAPEVTVHLQIASPSVDGSSGSGDGLIFAPGASETTLEGLEPATPYTFRLRASNASGFSPYSEEASATTFGRSGPCAADGETLCLLGGRFEARVEWRNPREPGGFGTGHAVPVPGSDLSGTFWFFSPQNTELIVKMLDATDLNGFFWHFYGALSDVEYWISVRDTRTGESRTFHNPPFEICGGADTGAFEPDPDAPGSSTPSLRSVIPGRSETRIPAAAAGTSPLRLQDRFEIEVEWHDPRSGDRGTGHPLAELGTGETGFLWFFQPDNVELVVKLLDGRPLNGHFWLFWGALSDVEYTIRVVDTVEHTEATYTNPAFNLCGGADLGTL